MFFYSASAGLSWIGGEFYTNCVHLSYEFPMSQSVKGKRTHMTLICDFNTKYKYMVLNDDMTSLYVRLEEVITKSNLRSVFFICQIFLRRDLVLSNESKFNGTTKQAKGNTKRK
jgi:hypothetical protein